MRNSIGIVAVKYDITIGSWFATGSHGSGGDAGKSSSSVLHPASIKIYGSPTDYTI